MKKISLLTLVICIFIISVPTYAFSNACLTPGYSALIFNAQKGSDSMDLRLGLDFGLTYTIGLHGSFVYAGENKNHLDLGMKMRLTELTDFNLAGKLGFYKSSGSDWQMSLGMMADKPFTSFTRGYVSVDTLVKDWTQWAYLLGIEYSFTQSTGVHLGLQRNFWTKEGEIAQLVFGVKTLF